jgi:hypothetical protein
MISHMRHGRIFLTHTALLQYNVQSVAAAAGMANARSIKTKFILLSHEKWIILFGTPGCQIFPMHPTITDFGHAGVHMVLCTPEGWPFQTGNVHFTTLFMPNPYGSGCHPME